MLDEVSAMEEIEKRRMYGDQQTPVPAAQQPPREPHLLRCGTCDYPDEIKDATGKWKRCPIAKCELSFERLSLIDVVGCASHSSRPHPPAPAFKRCCDSCINVPCKVLDRIPCLAQEKQENVCEDSGCTDIENCDEICQHSRIFSPLQMQEAKEQAARKATLVTLDKIIADLQKILEMPVKPLPWQIAPLSQTINYLQSLRTAAQEDKR